MNRYLITEYEKKIVSVYYEKDVAMDIEVHWAATIHKMERHCLAGREQEDFRAMQR